jgi:glycosyltransferase involved in cell wall biosynthesis
MNVCILTSTYPRFPGDGVGRFMQSIAEALAQLGHTVHVVAPYHPATRPQQGPIYIHYFRYSYLDRFTIMGYGQALYNDQSLRKLSYVLAPSFFISGLISLIKLHKKHRFDIIHAHWVIPNGPIATTFSLITNTPMIITLHGSDIFVSLKKGFLGFITKICFKYASFITVCSQHLYESALSLGAIPEQLRLIVWGADPAIFDPSNFPPQDIIRKSLKLPTSGNIILSLGRLVKKKGVEYLIKAAPYVKKKVPDVSIVIAGDGPELKTLKQLAVELRAQDYIHFIGKVDWDYVPLLLHASDVFVAPSIEDESGNMDGLPTTILEAMAAGKPVVATNIAGIPLVILDGRTGLLVPPRDSHALAEAIVLILLNKSLREKMGFWSRQMVINYLNWNRVAIEFSYIYINALKNYHISEG